MLTQLKRKTFGRIKLATNHGRDIDWKIAVHEGFPNGLLSDPAADWD